MKGRRTLLVAMGLLAVLLAPRSWAEEGGGGQAEAAVPTISGLRAAIRGDTIILSWIDDGPEAKAYAVYRSERPFAGSTLAGIASVAVVAPGKQGYIDRPPQGGSFYYAVAAISAEGQVLFTFKANQNATVVAISAEAPQAPAAPPAVAPAATATATTPPAASPSPPPLSGEPLIAKAAPATEKLPSEPPVQPKASPEPPQPAKPVAETPQPTETALAPAPAGPAVAPVSRSTPLPAFLYGDSSVLPGVGAAGATAPGQLPPETAKALTQLQDGDESAVVTGPELRLLPRAQREGDSATILLAAESLLTEGDWAGARAILEPLSRSADPGPERDGARFYIGITLAMEGRYRDALFEFLAAREAYPAQTKPWIDFVVEGLARP